MVVLGSSMKYVRIFLNIDSIAPFQTDIFTPVCLQDLKVYFYVRGKNVSNLRCYY